MNQIEDVSEVQPHSLDLSVLEESAKDGELIQDNEAFDEEQLVADLSEAIILLKRSKTLIDYLSDPELCKAVSKRERGSMTKLSGKLGEYIDSVESSYGEVGDNDLFV